jgi:glycosyltransferase involved in cell wall biosynthesis
MIQPEMPTRPSGVRKKKDFSVLNNIPPAPADIEVALLTGGQDRHYAFGLAMALSSKVRLDVIGSDGVDSPEMHTTPKLNFLNLQGGQRLDAGFAKKLSRVLTYYIRLVRYASIAKPEVFHILWNNRLELLDRTLLIVYYKLLGKKIALTAHNVNAGRRDSTDTLLNRLTLRIQYQLVDHIFVHTDKMKRELVREFGVHERAISVIPYGINNAVPETDLTSDEAKRRLGIRDGERTILFFGAIRPYKGLEYLITAFQGIAAARPDYRLIIAGEPKRGSEEYVAEIQRAINGTLDRRRIIQKLQFIPDEETELYFKAADLLVLPYTEIFQSGILMWGLSFGLPVVAADVGSFREDIIEGRTGFLCQPGDAADLARTIEKYFESDLFKDLHRRRQAIRDYACARHSWTVAGEMTRTVYAGLLAKGQSNPS